MTPQNVLALGAFLFLVAPGLAFELARERRRPGRSETTFREAGRTMLASLGFTLASLLVLALIGLKAPALVPDLRRWIADPVGYLRTDYGVVVWFFVAELLIALGLVAITDRVFAGRNKAAVRPTATGWWVIQAEAPRGMKPLVHVRLSNGTQYLGMYGASSTDAALDDRELILEPQSGRGGKMSAPRLCLGLPGSWCGFPAG